MTNKIKIDIISDVVCPWCIVGYNHLAAAIAELNLHDQVEIEWQPFELNPDMPAEGEELTSHLARKYGATKSDSDRTRENITKAGAAYGFNFNYFDDMKIVNTLDAHTLLDYARKTDQQTALKLRLFTAFFSEKKDISDQEVLINEASTIGISPAQARKILADNNTKSQVKTRASQWQQMGVNSVPTVVFNRTSALSGAQPQATFKQVLQELLISNKPSI